MFADISEGGIRQNHLVREGFLSLRVFEPTFYLLFLMSFFSEGKKKETKLREN